MSSILKSLKKLERETDRNLVSKETLTVNARLIPNRRITSHPRIRFWVLGIITAGVITAGGWFFARSRPVPTTSVPPAPSLPAVMKPEKKSLNASPPLTQPSQKPQPGLPASPPPAAAFTPGQPPAPGAQSPTQLIKQAIASRSKGGPSSRTKPELPENLPFSQAKPPASAVNPPSTGPKLPAAGSEAGDPAPLSAEAGLKLEALAWALAPESRFAVINSQIVREGDSVGGAKVERIDKEQVVLRKEGKLWQLRHRPQR